MSAHTSVHWDLLSKPSGNSAIVLHVFPQQSILKIDICVGRPSSTTINELT